MSGRPRNACDPRPLLALMPANDCRVADLLGVHRKTVMRWRCGAHMGFWMADRCALAVGRHPSEIWPHLFGPFPRAHCARGHEYTDETTAVRRDGGRRCLVCKRDDDRRAYWAKKAMSSSDAPPFTIHSEAHHRSGHSANPRSTWAA